MKQAKKLIQLKKVCYLVTRQCLNRRIDYIGKVTNEVNAWEEYRNNLDSTIKWQFTTDDTGVKLHRLYPTIEA